MYNIISFDYNIISFDYNIISSDYIFYAFICWRCLSSRTKDTNKSTQTTKAAITINPILYYDFLN